MAAHQRRQRLEPAAAGREPGRPGCAPGEKRGGPFSVPVPPSAMANWPIAINPCGKRPV